MINKNRLEIFSLSSDKEEKLWKDCIFVFDSSALLEFYYYSDEVKKTIFKEIFPKLINRLWIPNRVEYEYLKNRENVALKPIYSYENLVATGKDNKDSGYLQKIEDVVKTIDKELAKEIMQISGHFNTLKEVTSTKDKHPYLENELPVQNFEKSLTDFKQSIETQLENFKQNLNVFKSELEEEISNRKQQIQKIYEADLVLEELNKYFEVGKEYAFDETMEIVKEGTIRYQSKIPPGYEDKDKCGVDKYGDLIVWKEIIAYSQSINKPIILIINDSKKDWWANSRQPHKELNYEFHRKTNQQFWMYSLKDFIYEANELLGVNLDKQILTDIQKAETLNYFKDIETLEFLKSKALNLVTNKYNFLSFASHCLEVNIKNFDIVPSGYYMSVKEKMELFNENVNQIENILEEVNNESLVERDIKKVITLLEVSLSFTKMLVEELENILGFNFLSFNVLKT